jgi:hypothetical protein
MLLSSGGLSSYLGQDTDVKVSYCRNKIAPVRLMYQCWSLFRRVSVSYSRLETRYGSALLTAPCHLPGSTLQVELTVKSPYT